jgi:RNA polymerase sigma-70 factor (ECF subfamily)
MIIAWRRVDQLPAEAERARMWLFGIARGTLQNHDRGVRRRRALADRIRSSTAPLEAAPADRGLEVRDAIARLDSDDAELVRLVHWDRMTLAHAAELLGIPDSTARTRYARVKERLRVALGEQIRA